MRALTLIVSLFVASSVFGQISAVLTVNRPSSSISEWVSRNLTVIYVVTKQDSLPREVVIKTTLRLPDGTLVATKNLGIAERFLLQRGTRVFYGREVLELHAMVFEGDFKKTVERTGKLPAGTYQLEVQLVTAQDLAPLAAAQMRSFYLASLQLPVLLQPQNESTLDAHVSENVITFRWTPLSPIPQEPITYRLQVFQVYEYQKDLQALRGNQPLLDVVLSNRTQYSWNPRLPFRTDTTLRRFIWTIQTLNAQGEPVILTDGNGESRSEPFRFSVGKLIKPED